MSELQNTVCPKCMLSYLHVEGDGCPRCERDHEKETATRLFDEVGRLNDLLASHQRAGLRLESERDAAEKENERLTDALESCAQVAAEALHAIYCNPSERPFRVAMVKARNERDAALKERDEARRMYCVRMAEDDRAWCARAGKGPEESRPARWFMQEHWPADADRLFGEKDGGK